MCRVMEDMRNEAKAEGRAEGRAEILNELVAAGLLKSEDAAKFAPASADWPEASRS